MCPPLPIGCTRTTNIVATTQVSRRPLVYGNCFFLFIIHYLSYRKPMHHLCNGQRSERFARQSAGHQTVADLLEIATGVQTFGARPPRRCSRISALFGRGHGTIVLGTVQEQQRVRSVHQGNDAAQSDIGRLFEIVRALFVVQSCQRYLPTFSRFIVGH